MRANDRVTHMLEKTAEVLAPILDKLVFTGGAVVPFFLDQYKEDFRPTEDVDCVIEISGRLAYGRLEKELRKLKLVNDISSGVICRWKYDDVLIDIMPTDGKILGFENSWYSEGLKHSIQHFLPSGRSISIFEIEYLMASKIEAFWSRGLVDIQTSKDLEDIVHLILYSSRMERCLTAKIEVLRYLSKEFRRMLSRPDISEEIGGFLRSDEIAKGKVKDVIRMMNRIVVREGSF